MTDIKETTRSWSGYWICGEADPAPCLRRTFTLDQRPEQAVLHLCGLGWHELYVNGARADDRVLAPTVSLFDRHVAYIDYDVTRLLRTGANAVAVVLGNGWYNCRTEEVWNFAHATWIDSPKMICDLECDGRIVLSSDESWRQIPTPIVFNQLRNGEEYDARKEIPGMMDCGFDDSPYGSARFCNPPGGLLIREDMEPCRVCQAFEAEIREFAPNAFICDCGVNLTGWCEIEVEGTAGTKIDIEYGEQLTDDGDLTRSHIDSYVKSGRFQADVYYLKGAGREIWHPRFVYHGFRYCRITIWLGQAAIHRVTAQFIHTDFKSVGAFSCSDAMFNRLQSCARQSYLSNFTGIPTDCPHREKNGWTGDAELVMETGLWNFDCVRASANFLRILTDTQRPDGQLPGIAPASGWGYTCGPVWDSYLFEVPHQIRQFTGDDALFRQYIPNMERYMDFCRGMEHDGLLSFGLGDWDNYDGPHAAPLEMVVSSFYVHCARLLAEYRPEYAAVAQRTTDAINRKYYRGDGVYVDGQRCALALALAFGFSPEPQKTAERLVEAVRARRHKAGFGIVGAKFVPRMLAEYGFADDAFKVLTQPEFPGWGYWVEKFGATTLFETWRGNQSRNHIMYGDLSAWAFRYAAGIKPANGFRSFRIEPCFIDALDCVKAEHETALGIIRVDWRRERDGIRFHCDIPSGSRADIMLAGTRHTDITGEFSATIA